MLRYCAEPGCPNVVERGRCRDHNRAIVYDRSWRKASRVFLAEFPLCGMRPGGRAPVMSQCHERGITTAATQTDHVAPHGGDMRKFWDREGNWQALCRPCHAAKTRVGL